MKKSLLSLAILSVLSGCSFIPDYFRPHSPVEAQFVQEGGAPSKSQPLDVSWRNFFLDSNLRQVIALALEYNRDLRVAALNVGAYREQYSIKRSELFPQASFNGVSSRRRLPGMSNGGSGGGGTGSSSGSTLGNGDSGYIGTGNTSSSSAAISSWYSVTMGVSWELDLFGRLNSLREEALQNYFATEAARRSTQVSLIASVANTWLTWRADAAQLKLSQETLATRENTLALTQRRMDAGVATALEVSQARSAAETARTMVEQYSRAVALDRNSLTLLVGRKIPERLAPDNDQMKPTLVGFNVGLPSDLLLQRPDIVEAEYQLKAANADVGAARSAFFPTISLTTSGGTASTQSSKLFQGGTGYWDFIPRITVPIFTAGQLKASLNYSELTKDVRVAQYEKAIQTAFREVNDGLAARTTYVRQVSARENLVDANQEYYRLATRRYEAGVDNYLTLLDAQRELFTVQQELITDRLNQQISEVNLFKALGGGWQQDASGASVPKTPKSPPFELSF